MECQTITPCLVSFVLSDACKAKPVVIERRKMSDSTIAEIQQHLLFHDWSVINPLDVNDSYSYLLEVITKSLDLYAPKRVIQLKADDRFREAWLTVKLKNIILSAESCAVKLNVPGYRGIMSGTRAITIP